MSVFLCFALRYAAYAGLTLLSFVLCSIQKKKDERDISSVLLLLLPVAARAVISSANHTVQFSFVLHFSLCLLLIIYIISIQRER